MKNTVKTNPIPDELNLALQLDKLPIATPDMTEEELRDVILKFMYLQGHFAFTPDLGGIGEYKYHIKNLYGRYKGSENLDNIMIPFEEGKYYGGVPYMGNSAGSVYRWLEFYDAETGVMDWAPILRTRRENWVDPANGRVFPDVGSSYFGNTCASSCVWSWLRVTNKVDSFWTYTCIPKYGFVKVGDYELAEDGTYGPSTKELCKKNGKERIFNVYSQMKRADGMVKSGHAAMCASNAVTVRDENGNIDGENSYVLVCEQTAGFLTAPPTEGGVEHYSPLNDKGDVYRIQGNYTGNIVNGKVKEMKWTFNYLFDAGYLPFTIPELCGLAPVDKSEVGLYKSGEIYNAEEIKAGDLKNMTVESNYPISDVHFIVRDGDENQLFSAMYAARTEDLDRTTLVKVLKSYSLKTALSDNVIYADKEYIGAKLSSFAQKGEHTLEITARVSTGELLTVFKGALTE